MLFFENTQVDGKQNALRKIFELYAMKCIGVNFLSSYFMFIQIKKILCCGPHSK